MPPDDAPGAVPTATPSALEANAAYPDPLSQSTAAQREFDSLRRLSLPWLADGVAPSASADTVPLPSPASTASTLLEVPPAAASNCAGIAVRSGADLTVDGHPFVFFGVNAHYLLDKEYPEADVEPLLAALAERGVNTIRLFYFSYHDPERMARLLAAGSRHGIRFVVTLADDVFHGVDWFGSSREQKAYTAHLDDTVQRFKDRPEVLFWELVNEPNCGEGKFDDDCLKTIRGWIGEMAERVTAIDACHIVSTGMIGAGNYETEETSFRMANRKKGIGIVSVHRRDTDKTGKELAFAQDEDRPIFYGEIYDEAYDAGCQPLEGDQSPKARADRIKSDLRQAIDDGVDGYLLWDFAAKGYCSKFGFDADDPLWNKLRDAENLPPPVPWR